MTWRCYDGEAGRFPLGLTARLARDTKPKKEDVLELVAGYTNLHATVVKMEAAINELKADNLRLKHENDFMLRLVNDRESSLPLVSNTPRPTDFGALSKEKAEMWNSPFLVSAKP